MPYIKQVDRVELLNFPDRTIANAGELNFLITCLLTAYLRANGERYQTYNDCVGALEGAKMELYRQVIAPYEDTKLKENGDVYHVRDEGFYRKATAGATAT
jgi:hypothetical protein